MTGSSNGPLIAGVELGGTKIVCLLAAGPDDIREQVRLPTTTPAESLGAIRRVLERWNAGPGFAALGIASFGPLELDDRSDRFGQIVSTTKPGWDGADLNTLGEDLGIPVMIDTDVNGAALAEGRWGAARGLRSYAYITVGTGVGVGSIVSGQPVRGAGHSEAGHLRVGRLPGDVWPGACRFHRDCVEGLASGPAIEARAGRPGGALSHDDPAWDMVVHALGGLLHNLVLTTVPERILIGGGVADGQAWLFPRVRTALTESLNNYAAMDRTLARMDDFVQPPLLGTLAGPLGAIALGCLAAGV
ncbi:ROK family protein [Brevundimonas sp.]|uniref:ROK family protein n=1 Tax=Brevundimonas sp. TaxID=1871086 RepID=UPI002FC640A9